MKGLIIINPNIDFSLLKKYEKIILIEKASLLASKIKPFKIIGDFDSITNSEKKKLFLNYENLILKKTNQCTTDLEFAIEYLRPFVKQIDCYIKLGQRIDHLLNQYHLVVKYGITIFDENNKLFLLKENMIVKKDHYHYFSIFLKEKIFLKITGCKYKIDGEYNVEQNSKMISNEFVLEKIKIKSCKQKKLNAIICLSVKDI